VDYDLLAEKIGALLTDLDIETVRAGIREIGKRSVAKVVRRCDVVITEIAEPTVN
jgi:hypothetical protein